MLVLLLIFLLYILPSVLSLFLMWILTRWEGRTIKEMWGEYVEMCFVPVVNILYLCSFIFGILYTGFYAIILNISYYINKRKNRE
jgi:hypothetical protein